MAAFNKVLRFLAIGCFLAMVSGCDEEYWFNADGSGRYRWILNEEEIKAYDAKNEGFEKNSEEFKQRFVKSKLRANMTRDVVFGKKRWIFDLEYDSNDQLSWIDDKMNKNDYSRWKSTIEPNGDLKYQYSRELKSSESRNGPDPRQVTVHLPGRIITSNADTVDEKQNIALWDITTHKSITPTVIVRLPPVPKKK